MSSDVTRILFLDFDGVVNRRATFKPGRGVDPIDAECIAHLQTVCSTVANLKIVVSSTWRKNYSALRLSEMLHNAGLMKFEIIGVTPSLPGQPTREDGPIIRPTQRGHEIAAWLKEGPENACYAIVDDDNDMLADQQSRFVQTTFETGLTADHARRIIDVLNHKPEQTKDSPSCPV